MTYKEKLSAILSKGYFPKELPFTFETKDFGIHANEIIDQWRANRVFSLKPARKISKKNKRNAYGYIVGATESEVISMPKRGFERRNINITHPIPQDLLCLDLSKNWLSIQKWLMRQKYSIDKI
ncbi:hypothetical protein FV222_09220 [Methylobacterium sp. WL103]|uniref:hypothetical protein n=1 Tax=Methylobacterium sp. WL103 TaxID=2603891 RepID=UPI0011C7D487|nr:hypothetical protein [Methylobacterium sp. WL103]TXN02803.1 hypothetical protein FV222_09220 [Methylobacterium sp. WL103]